MNSVSDLMGKFNGLSNQLLNQSQHENKGKHVGQQLEHMVGRQRERNSEQVALYDVSFSFSSSSMSKHDKGVRVLEQELQIRFEGASFSPASRSTVPAFELPSPDDVAKNVLGFVENRIKQESADGASQQRLDNLLSQARKGVEKGFGEAKEQIKQLGLMTDELKGEIDQSFDKINVGLDKLADKYTGGAEEKERTRSGGKSRDVEKLVDEQPVKSEKISSREKVSGAETPALSGVSGGYSSYSATSERAAIQITTQDGDVVSFNLEQIQASFERGELSSNRFGFESAQMAGQYSVGQYSYSIDGELDEGEIQALNDLMVQIEGMSEQFFSGNFQDAFQSALELGFDSQEIAGFSVNLSQSSLQQVSAYQQVAELGGQAVQNSANRFDPLSQFFDSLQAAFDKASAFSQPGELVSTLFDRVLDDRFETDEQARPQTELLEPMHDYVQALLDDL